MAIDIPTVDTVKNIATSLGLTISSSDSALFQSMLANMCPAYERLAAMDAPAPDKPARGNVGRKPDSAENPYNAWAWKGPIEPTGKGVLNGFQVGIKDAICVAGMPSTNGSKLLERFVPSEDATVVTRILAAGGTIAGKTTCEDLSYSGNSHTSRPAVRNPHKPAHSAGGSSSGNGAAIAAGDIAMAVGCDQGGSIRIPSAWCGVVGLKPTRGLVPYTGAFGIDGYIDYCGPMGRRVEDVARLLTAIARPDGLDPRQHGVNPPPRHYLDELAERRRPRRIAMVREGFSRPESDPETDRQVREAILKFRSLGVEVEEISVPTHLTCFDVWHAIVVEGTSELMFKADGFAGYSEGYASAEMLQAFSVWRQRPDDIVPTALPALLMGEYMRQRYQSRYYARAKSLLHRMREEFDAVLSGFDAMAMPTIPFRAMALPPENASTRQIVEDALPMVGNTSPYNASGHPAISLPCGSADDLPIGMMLIGKHFGEADLLSAAATFESL